ncbi:PadR family transcriptional regulator [Acuticoccus yangtzensis]|uniref:PadR family transcriptional regulator n=1 Tax=Acuticoccus yangtzensis TaxID=1443441 RepID=UPI0009496FE4|nr:PadR family transcriptional regulator [Acuticoccus yangtzensis]
MPREPLSPVTVLCLAILFNDERTGYEIRKQSLEGRHRWFVDASYGSIYPALARLAQSGLVTVREEVQSGRPSRKVYAITTEGRAALIEELSEPPGPDIFRSRFLLVSSFAPHLPRRTVEAAIEERKAGLAEEIAAIEAAVAESECAGERDCDALSWAAAYGRNCLGAHLDFLKTHGDSLIAMAEGGTDASLPKAAE